MANKSNSPSHSRAQLEKLVSLSLFLRDFQKEWLLSHINDLTESEQKDLSRILQEEKKREDAFLQGITKRDPNFVAHFRNYQQKVKKRFFQHIEQLDGIAEEAEDVLKDLDS